MSKYVSKELRREVVERARNICEYCRIPPKLLGISHQIEHILPRQHGGETVTGNLALACAVCNRYKGTNISSYDFETGNLTALFNPRTQNWAEHFQILERRN